jgi:hypothetical protein
MRQSRFSASRAKTPKKRKRTLLAGYLTTALFSGVIVLNELGQQSQQSRILERGFLIAGAGSFLALTLKQQFSTSATDKFIELWRKDPHHRALDLSLAPIAGGGMFALSGSF